MPYRKGDPKQPTLDSFSNTKLKLISQNYSLQTERNNAQTPQSCSILGVENLLNNSAGGYTNTLSDYPCTALNSPNSVETMVTNLLELPIPK
jgi:hypothetical protein